MNCIEPKRGQNVRAANLGQQLPASPRCKGELSVSINVKEDRDND